MAEDAWDRRDTLQGLSAVAAVGMLAAAPARAAAQEVKWSTGTEKPKIKVPANACDCHHHIYGSQYKVDPTSTLRPGDATVDDYRALQKRIGTTRNVIVQPSTYGTENAPTLDALVAFGPTRAGRRRRRHHGHRRRAEAHARARRARRPLQPGAGRRDDPGDARTAGEADQRSRLAHPDQRHGGEDHGDHADPRNAAVRRSCSTTSRTSPSRTGSTIRCSARSAR